MGNAAWSWMIIVAPFVGALIAYWRSGKDA